MTWHVYESQCAGLAVMQPGKPQINGQSAALLLGQLISVLAGQCLDQRGFTVVDMSGGSKDHSIGTGV